MHSSSTLTCSIYKPTPFKLEDRPPLLTDKEITFIESLVNQAHKSAKGEAPIPEQDINSEVTFMYDFLGKLFFFYATYHVCLISLYFVLVFGYNTLGFLEITKRYKLSN